MRILVVDDEQRLARSVARGLEAEGFDVDVVFDGSVTAVHTFYWSNMRMRAPLTPVIALAAAAGVARAVRASS